ncbi:hypothetical protein FLA105534_02288 [Flavobacterium bizetiae]|uniref:Thioredoxin domain-containing protein n=1 Tax=Flavobacterium bizetiae TaxID=2704140 RepID=A0A6J4GME9_9FLAO|nr:hypothetical protein [Flavobacterium bizetiae]CAA9198667.1 hypothetical protein FLA105534_02288 [Flavobacterium bizetiae]CAD5341044.1 hypothetical protein FLA105535_01006 [Flavobacterium bizetiae]CAD5347275.1 hypothetical protein FLA105534_01230 [Flavobacterium bizetiae]
MRNYVLLWLVFLLVSTSSFAQQETLKSKSYYSVDNLGRRMKFNLLDNNKFELVLSYGDYEVTNDSLLFKNKDGDKSVFEVQYIKNAKIKQDKIKVSFEEYSSLYGIYIGAQNGTDSIHYQKVSDLTGYDGNGDFNESFEMNRTQYLYFVNEGFDYEPKQIFKYEIPNAITELKVKVNYVLPNIAIKGYLDRKRNELSIGAADDNMTVFHSEEPIVDSGKSIIPPLERKQVLSWTYPGKEDTDVASPEENDDLPKTDFKLNIAASLPKALQQTKADGNKFLVVYADPKNTEAKAEFDALIEKQERYIGYISNTYDPQYDLYNFCLASKEDESWLKKNKMTDSPMLMVLDANGTILAWANSNLSPDKIDKFMYYDSFNGKLKRTFLKNNFAQIINDKNSKDAKLVKAFHEVSALGALGDYDYEYSEEDGSKDDFKFIKFNLDKKKARQVWKKIIEAHQKDTSPDMLLVQAIFQEIKNVGYTKQVYLEDKILDEVDFKSIDYLLKHYDAIDAERAALNDQENNLIKIGNISTEISNALQNATSTYNEDGSYTKSDPKKIKDTYEKILLIDKANFQFYASYFSSLADWAEKTKSNNERIKEFEKYFDKYLVNKENIIQNLDKIYDNGFDANALYYYDWKEFKNYHANLFNEISWAAVLDSKNQSYIKKAINWSECSLTLNKSNPFYLDTLAQLYYKDGQKEKAVETQTLAVKHLKDEAMEDTTANDIKETLSKMQNGTY